MKKGDNTSSKDNNDLQFTSKDSTQYEESKHFKEETYFDSEHRRSSNYNSDSQYPKNVVKLNSTANDAGANFIEDVDQTKSNLAQVYATIEDRQRNMVQERINVTGMNKQMSESIQANFSVEQLTQGSSRSTFLGGAASLVDAPRGLSAGKTAKTAAAGTIANVAGNL